MDMKEGEGTRRLAAIFSADAKNYSKLMFDDENATVALITNYREIMSTLILQHHGRVVDSPGDNILAEFSSVVDAVQGAVAIQKELKAHNDQLPNHRRMEFRIGINLGDVIVKGDRIYGDGVNIASRLETMSDAGGICISRTAYDQIEDKLPLGYEFLGETTTKNLKKPLLAYKVNIWPQTYKLKLNPINLLKNIHPLRNQRKTSEQVSIKNSKRIRSQRLFLAHLKSYLGIIGFLFLINILSYSGVIWFHWPALGWGLFLYLHWIKKSYSSKKN
jgi:adenylate cyclase